MSTVATGAQVLPGSPSTTGARLGAGPSALRAARSADGRNRVSSKALHRLVTAVSADALGVAPKSVSIDLADEMGQLVVTVRSPLGVVSLDQVRDDRSIVARTGGTLLQRSTDAQGVIRSRASELSGSQIARVVIRLTGVDIRTERRVS